MDPCTRELQEITYIEINERAKLQKEVADLKEAVTFLLDFVGWNHNMAEDTARRFDQLCEKLGVNR